MRQILIMLCTILSFPALVAMEAGKWEFTQTEANEAKQQQEQLIWLIKYGSVDDALDFLVRARWEPLDVNYKDAHGHTAMYYAKQRMTDTRGEENSNRLIRLLLALRSRGAVSV